MLNLLFLLIAITLECCGDASIRVGLRSGKPLLFALGAILVIAYGTIVSFPNWRSSPGSSFSIFSMLSFLLDAVTISRNQTIV